MSGQRQPIELVSAKSSKYLKKRSRGEKAQMSNLLLTIFLSSVYQYQKKKKQKVEFDRVANQ